jgi:hypothetical protein
MFALPVAAGNAFLPQMILPTMAIGAATRRSLPSAPKERSSGYCAGFGRLQPPRSATTAAVHVSEPPNLPSASLAMM